MKKTKIITLAFAFIFAVLFSCSKDDNEPNEEIININSHSYKTFGESEIDRMFKSKEFNDMILKMDEIFDKVDHTKFILSNAINGNNTFNQSYIIANLGYTSYNSVQEFTDEYDNLFRLLQTVKENHPVLSEDYTEEIFNYFDNVYDPLGTAPKTCATEFRKCNRKATRTFLYSLAMVPTCGVYAGYCFGVAVLSYNSDRGDCKDDVLECLGIEQ